jgi:choline dehydrogenase
VLCAGVFGTPQILTLSGIGPAESLEELNIEPVFVNDAVGQNLHDHPWVPIVSLIEPTPFDGIRNHLKWTTEAAREIDVVDDVVSLTAVMNPAVLNIPGEAGSAEAWLLVNVLGKPQSTGYLKVVSTDPQEQPEIHSNYLGDPIDMARMKEAVRLMYSIATTEPVKSEIREVLQPPADALADDATLEAWLHQTVTTTYHATSTCRMGNSVDDGSVVDQRLAVHGVQNLWIGDASVMPRVTTGLTNLTVHMIGERLADWLSTH